MTRQTVVQQSLSLIGLMVRSAAKQRVSNHGAAPSFETPRSARLLRMRRIKAPALPRFRGDERSMRNRFACTQPEFARIT
jgi:hypothetical protein